MAAGELWDGSKDDATADPTGARTAPARNDPLLATTTSTPPSTTTPALAYVEVRNNEKAVTTTGFTLRANQWFADYGITVDAVMTDNGACYPSNVLTDTLQANGIRHLRSRPADDRQRSLLPQQRLNRHPPSQRHQTPPDPAPYRRPQLNSKAERFNRTMTDE